MSLERNGSVYRSPVAAFCFYFSGLGWFWAVWIGEDEVLADEIAHNPLR